MNALFAIALLLSIATACTRPPAIKVGSKNTTEQLILGEIVSQHLEKQMGRTVERRFGFAGTMPAHQALQAGDVDLYPEYTGIALTTILKVDPMSEPSVVLERCRQEYRQRMGAEWLEPFGFNNSFAIIVRSDDAQSKKLEGISDAESIPDSWRLAVGYEFQNRREGLGSLNRTYKLPWRGAPRAMDPSLMFAALGQKSVDMLAANVTDGLLNSIDAKILKDDREAFLPHQAAIIVRQDTLAANQGMQVVLAQLSGKINEDAMRRMNFEVDGKKRQPRDVAAEWLKSAGL